MNTAIDGADIDKKAELNNNVSNVSVELFERKTYMNYLLNYFDYYFD